MGNLDTLPSSGWQRYWKKKEIEKYLTEGCGHCVFIQRKHFMNTIIVLCCYLQGRVKKVLENYTQNFTAPTEGFDCHVSEQLPSVSANTSSFLAFERTQVRRGMWPLIKISTFFPLHVDYLIVTHCTEFTEKLHMSFGVMPRCCGVSAIYVSVLSVCVLMRLSEHNTVEHFNAVAHVKKEKWQVHQEAQAPFVLTLQYYMYELLDDGSNDTAPSPSAACPLAIVSFSYTDTKATLVTPQEKRYGIATATHALSWVLKYNYKLRMFRSYWLIVYWFLFSVRRKNWVSNM